MNIVIEVRTPEVGSATDAIRKILSEVRGDLIGVLPGTTLTPPLLFFSVSESENLRLREEVKLLPPAYAPDERGW